MLTYIIEDGGVLIPVGFKKFCFKTQQMPLEKTLKFSKSNYKMSQHWLCFDEWWLNSFLRIHWAHIFRSPQISEAHMRSLWWLQRTKDAGCILLLIPQLIFAECEGRKIFSRGCYWIILEVMVWKFEQLNLNILIVSKKLIFAGY